jgi:predicted dehydrogenase
MGVIGCDPIGMLHARAIANSPGAQLVAICEINGRRIEEAERTFDVPSYLDVTEMLAEAATDSIHAGEKIEVAS